MENQANIQKLFPASRTVAFYTPFRRIFLLFSPCLYKLDLKRLLPLSILWAYAH